MDKNEELFKLAKAAAKRVCFQWPDQIEEDDLTQEIVLRLWETPGSVERLFAEDEITRKAFMVKVGHQVASNLMNDYNNFTGNYIYRTDEVKTLLEEQIWALPANSRLIEENLDLLEALDNLLDRNEVYWTALMERFGDEVYPQDSAGKMRVSRALTSLTEEMNRIGARRRKARTEGPGTKPRITAVEM